MSTFFSPNLFLHLCNHSFPAVNGSLSLASGIPCRSPHNSVMLSGATCWNQSHHVFYSRLPPQMQRLSPPKSVSCTASVTVAGGDEAAKLARISPHPLFTTSWIEDSFLPNILAISHIIFSPYKVENFHLKEAFDACLGHRGLPASLL